MCSSSHHHSRSILEKKRLSISFKLEVGSRVLIRLKLIICYFKDEIVYFLLHHIGKHWRSSCAAVHDTKFAFLVELVTDRSLLFKGWFVYYIKQIVCGVILGHTVPQKLLFHLMILASLIDPCLNKLFHQGYLFDFEILFSSIFIVILHLLFLSQFTYCFNLIVG